MFTRERPADALGPTGEPPTRRSALLDHLGPLALLCVVGGVIAVFYLGLYPAKRYSLPIGWDTPRYLSQANFVAQRGLSGVPGRLPPPSKTLPGRPGFPIVLLTLSGLFHQSTFRVSIVVPVVAAVALSLAAGALASFSLRWGAWEAAAVALVVGTSAVLIRLMAPETYTDNLLSGALTVAALLVIVSVVRDGTGGLAAILLLGAAGLAHPLPFFMMLAVLGLVTVIFLPGSWRSWRRGETGAWSTPSGRLGTVLAGSAILMGMGLFGVVRAPPDTPFLTRSELTKKLRQDVRLYEYPLTLPMAALGVGVLGAGGSGRRRRDQFAARFLLIVAGAWALVTLAGVADYLAGGKSPAHRFLAFLLPLPLLIAVGLIGTGRLIVARGARATGIAAVLVAMSGLALVGLRDFYVTLPRDRGVEWLDFDKVRDAMTASAYLQSARVPETAPVVFVVDDSGPDPLSYVPEMAYIIRSVLPPDRVEHTYFYVGDPENYLAGQPTYRSFPPTYDANEQRFWPTIQRLLPLRPVAILPVSFNPAAARFAARHPGAEIAPGLIVLKGDPPRAPVRQSTVPEGLHNAATGAALGTGALVILSLLGLGWAAVLSPPGVRSFEVLALSPAFGIAAMIWTGMTSDLIGLRLGGPGNLLVIGLVAVAGVVLAARRLATHGPDALPAR